MMKRICFEDEAKKMMCKKYKWNFITFQDISWTEHNKAIESPTFNTRKQKLKFIHNRLSIGVLNYESNNKCPFCNNEEKNNNSSTTKPLSLLQQHDSTTPRKDK